MGAKFWIFYTLNFISSLIFLIAFIFTGLDIALAIAGVNAIIMLQMLLDWMGIL